MTAFVLVRGMKQLLEKKLLYAAEFLNYIIKQTLEQEYEHGGNALGFNCDA